MKASAWVVVALASLLAGCHSEVPAPGDPLTLPPAAEVEQIEVTRWTPNESYQSSFKIRDRRRIEAILAGLRSVNRNFYLSMDGWLTQEVSLTFSGQGKLKAMVEAGQVSWDVVDVEGDYAAQAGKDGLLEKLKSKPILLVCQSGQRSGAAERCPD